MPIIAISALFNNSSRLTAFLKYADFRRAGIVLACAVPTCVLGAWGYTRLSSAGAALVIGAMLILSVPLRRHLKKRDFKVGDGGLALGAVGYGVVVGGTAGSGVILLSLLMAAGVRGAGVIATDAAISIVIGVVKTSVFGLRRRAHRAGSGVRAADRHRRVAGRVPGAALCRAHAAARAHRDPRRGGVRGRCCDDRGGAALSAAQIPFVSVEPGTQCQEYWIPAFAGMSGDQFTHGHFTTGGIEDRIDSTLPPVLSPKIVPRS